mmetsp:Transcript_11617/g.31125  ORF Transcript_11617/g.31125 Transcript_11617/m.31125 type:complete len:195 (+) Transcript_11617:63-647(+)
MESIVIGHPMRGGRLRGTPAARASRHALIRRPVGAASSKKAAISLRLCAEEGRAAPLNAWTVGADLAAPLEAETAKAMAPDFVALPSIKEADHLFYECPTEPPSPHAESLRLRSWSSCSSSPQCSDDGGCGSMSTPRSRIVLAGGAEFGASGLPDASAPPEMPCNRSEGEPQVCNSLSSDVGPRLGLEFAMRCD